MRKSALLLSSTLLASETLAITLPAKARRSSHGSLKVANHQNLVYSTTIKLGGKEFEVQLDTGSSDLWVPSEAEIPGTKSSTAISLAIIYPSGVLDGVVDYADLELGGYKVPSQAFIRATGPHPEQDRLIHNGGVLGLGFERSSFVNQFIVESEEQDSNAGHTTLHNIFNQDPNAPLLFSLKLGRIDDPKHESESVFTISEYIQGLESVQNEPELPRLAPASNATLERWNIEVDGFSVNDEFFFDSQKPIAALDSGLEYVLVDVEAADAIYSTIPGAVKVEGSELWLVPCLNTTEVEFQLGGKDFPIHPLDLTVPHEIEGYTACINTFRGVPQSERHAELHLGAPFFRNAYVTFNYGTIGTEGSEEGSFVQLLSTTTFDKAKPEFVQVRTASLQSMPPVLEPEKLAEIIGDKGVKAIQSDGTTRSGGGESDETVRGRPWEWPYYRPVPQPTATNGGDPSRSTSVNNQLNAFNAKDDTDLEELISKVGGYAPAIVGLLAANLFFLIVLSLIGAATCLRGRGKARSVSPTYAPVKFKESDGDEETLHAARPYSH